MQILPTYVSSPLIIYSFGGAAQPPLLYRGFTEALQRLYRAFTEALQRLYRGFTEGKERSFVCVNRKGFGERAGV